MIPNYLLIFRASFNLAVFVGLSRKSHRLTPKDFIVSTACLCRVIFRCLAWGLVRVQAVFVLNDDGK